MTDQTETTEKTPAELVRAEADHIGWPQLYRSDVDRVCALLDREQPQACVIVLRYNRASLYTVEKPGAVLDCLSLEARQDVSARFYTYLHARGDFLEQVGAAEAKRFFACYSAEAANRSTGPPPVADSAGRRDPADVDARHRSEDNARRLAKALAPRRGRAR